MTWNEKFRVMVLFCYWAHMCVQRLFSSAGNVKTIVLLWRKWCFGITANGCDRRQNKNRSYRGYNKSRKVTKEELMELVDIARLCPSSANIQPLCYYLAWEPDEVARIQEQTRWAGAITHMKLPHPGMEPPAFIVILQDTKINDSMTRFQKDVGIVAQTMLLAAAEKGLGGCMIGSFHAQNIREILNLDKSYVPVLVVAIGEPEEKIVLEDVEPEESTNYYRDEQDVHYVPKRKLKDIAFTAEKK